MPTGPPLGPSLPSGAYAPHTDPVVASGSLAVPFKPRAPLTLTCDPLWCRIPVFQRAHQLLSPPELGQELEVCGAVADKWRVATGTGVTCSTGDRKQWS